MSVDDFMKEAAVMKCITHPHLVQLLGTLWNDWFKANLNYKLDCISISDDHG